MSTNLYRLLRELLPDSPLQIVTVLAINTDGTSIVEYPGGAQTKVRGTNVAVSSPAFVRDGVIEGPAPALTFETIEV